MMRGAVAGWVAGLGIIWIGVPSSLAAIEPGESEPAATAQASPGGSVEGLSAQDETEYAYGVVQSVADGSLVVSEYDLAAGKTVQATYTLDPKVSLTNVRSLEEIAAGDGVDIDYVMHDGARIATAINVEKATEEDLNSFDEESELY